MELVINILLHAGAIGMIFYAGYLYGVSRFGVSGQ